MLRSGCEPGREEWGRFINWIVRGGRHPVGNYAVKYRVRSGLVRSVTIKADATLTFMVAGTSTGWK